jgi:2-oxoglutarate ferredoxin oxidoreductase subunit gamma
MADIMFTGIGGQGVQTAGKILIEVAAGQDKNVCWTSEYSAEMRGGTCLCRVVISDEEVGNPYPDLLDVMCCFTESGWDDHGDEMRDSGTVVINSSLFDRTEFPEGLQVWGVDAAEITHEVKNPRGVNLVILGAMLKAYDLLPFEDCAEALFAYFDKKKRNPEGNVACFRLGYERAERIQG